jgi:hypothetical protein
MVECDHEGWPDAHEAFTKRTRANRSTSRVSSEKVVNNPTAPGCCW